MGLWQLLLLGSPIVWLIVIFGLIGWRPSRRVKYLGMLLATALLIVAPLQVLSQEVRQSVEIPGYRVEFWEKGDLLYFDVPRYFYISRADGQKADFLIDIDATRCLDLKTPVQGDRIYFQCSGEPLSEASFVDQKQKTVYSGYRKQEVAIAELEFSPPAK